MRRHLVLIVAGALAAAAVATTNVTAGAASTCAAPEPMRFDEPGYVDTTRAGGEPIVFTHPDGTLLYGSHAGTTHFFAPESASEQIAAFGGKYNGQTYYYYSADHGRTWTYSDRTLPPSGAPASGFSDPDFAYDTAGNVYVSEINLVNVSMSKSSDRGRTYGEQNRFAQVMADRQWSEADQKDVVYMVGNVIGGGTFPSDPAGNSGHLLFKSKDGGATFNPGITDTDGLGDLRVDKSDGTLYETALKASTELYVRAFRNARSDTMTPEDNLVAEGVDMIGHWPSFDVDPSGNLYITWDEGGDGDREPGVYYAYSVDRGKTWSEPVRLDADSRTSIWPWLAVGDDGRVGVAWFEATEELPLHDAETTGDHGWTVQAAASMTGLGCATSSVPGFTRSAVVAEPVHTGTICQGGTGCQATATDRRLGDYFSVEVAADGAFVAAYSDTRKGGPVALPGFARQISGPRFLESADTVAPAPTRAAPKPRSVPLPATGGLPYAVLAGALVLMAASLRQWRRRTA